MSVDYSQIAKEVATHLSDSIKTEVYEQTKSKDEELSGLHRQILGKIEEVRTDVGILKETVESHHEFIEYIRQLLKTGSYIRKFVLWVFVFVPGAAGFLAGLTFIYKYFNDN